MEALTAILQTWPALLISVGIEYRFAYKILGIRFSNMFTFCIMVLVYHLFGWLNVGFHLASNIMNTFYYASISLILYLFLFKGKTVRKVFLTILINCGMSMIFFLLVPFVRCFFVQRETVFLFSLQVLEYVSLFVCAVGLEYVGKKFQNLRRELPTGYTIYLSAVIIFVYIAIYLAHDQILVFHSGIVSFRTAATMALFAVAGMIIAVVAIFAVDRQVDVSLKEQLSMVQAENLKRREMEWRRISGFRHDIKNHLICLNRLLESGKTQQAVSYMHNLTDTVNQLDCPVQTGNDYADALLSAKYIQAVEYGIDVTLEMAIPAQGFVKPVDLCCILSNAFDNAIAACNRLNDGKRWIRARAFTRQGQFVIAITNSKPADVTVINGVVFPKEITADHGLGLDTVKMVVEQYGGTLILSAEKEFSFSVLLPLRRL